MNIEEQKLAEYMLRVLEMPVFPFTPWEVQFLENVTVQYARCRQLSDKQFQALKGIYDGSSIKSTGAQGSVATRGKAETGAGSSQAPKEAESREERDGGRE